jgi:hypothetical protein
MERQERLPALFKCPIHNYSQKWHGGITTDNIHAIGCDGMQIVYILSGKIDAGVKRVKHDLHPQCFLHYCIFRH